MKLVRLWLMAAVIACGAPPSAATSATPTDRSSTPRPSVSSTPIPPTTAMTSPSPERPRIARNDLAAHVRVLKRGWRPEGRTVLFTMSDGPVTTLIAVPVVPGAEAVRILELIDVGGYQIRPDGHALVAAFANGDDSSRIATLDLASGTGRWITADEPGFYDRSPVWSPDGSFVYYSEQASTVSHYGDRGLFRVSVDGSLSDLGTTLVHRPEGNGGDPVSVSPDGRWLSWTRGQAGGSTDVLDLKTGVNRTFDIAGASGDIAWRVARPRALVMSSGCCAGRPGGQLILWDDISGTTTELNGPDTGGPLLSVGLAAWDPSGTRIATSVFERSATFARNVVDSPIFIAIFDAAGAYLGKVPGTSATWLLAWLPEGLLVIQSSMDGIAELRLIAETGASSFVLYRTPAPNFRFAGTVTP